MNQFMRQLEEKNVAHEIDILLWSDRMDLVAFSNIKGEVALHRITWTRAWNLSPPKEGDLVRGLAWRPDGKVLAVGYQSGLVLLVSVENKSILHSFEVDGEISCLHWSQEIAENLKNNKNIMNPSETSEYVKFLDSGNIFLPTVDNSTFTSSTTQELEVSNLFKNQKELNLLIVGTKAGMIYISIFGCFLPIKVNVNNLLGMKCSISNIHMSENLNTIFVTVCDEIGQLKMAFVNSEIFKTHRKELFAMAVKYENLNSLIVSLSGTIANVKEHWESIFLEMDSKLSKFASKVPEGTLSADFLDLLMYGICSDEMQEFLLHDLTKKGLEKFGQTIEMSYGNIHKLLLKNVSKAGQSIAYHLLDLRGMARLEHRYGVLGLQEDKITAALLANGSFLVKGGEMQHIISHSGISYKAFFRWLYTAILHLMEETIPPEIQKGTQQDIAIVSEFLLNFDAIGVKSPSLTPDKPESGFIMERLGQYLSDSPLTIPSKMENEWEKFLMKNDCLQEHPIIVKHHRDKSLIQEYNSLKASVNEIFEKPASFIGKHIVLNSFIGAENITEKNLRMTCLNSGSDTIYAALLDKGAPADYVYFLEFRMVNTGTVVRGACLYFSHSITIERDVSEGNYNIMDIKFYSPSVLSLLLQENSPTKTGVLGQCPIQFIVDKLLPIDVGTSFQKSSFVCVDGTKIGTFPMNNIVGLKVLKFSVSGARKVSIVLSDSKRRVRLYEMEVDDEEEEDNELTTSTMRESDTSAHENSDAE